MPQPPPMKPLPVVTTLQRLSRSQMNGLRGHYGFLYLDNSASDQSINKFYKALVSGIFRFLGSDDQRHEECFDACVDMCKSTRVIDAESWATWRGFAKFLEMMEKTTRLTRQTGLLHCPAAPYLVVAIAMQQVILHGIQAKNNTVHKFFRDFDSFDKAATAIYFYQKHWRQEYLTLDQPWDLLTPIALQYGPNTKLHPLDGRVVIQILRTPGPEDHTSDEVIEVKDEQTPIKQESSAAHQASEFREERHEAAMPMPMPVETQMITQMPVPMSIPAPVLAQVPVPAQITMPTPMPNPAPTSALTPRPTMVRETLMEVFRGDVMAKLQPLLDRLKSENWNGIIQRDIMEVLTDKNVRVLPSLAKQTVRLWATRSQNAMLLSWLEQARDDVDVFQWTERFVEPAPSAWTIPQSAHSVFHDLDAIIARVPQLDLRGLLQAKMSTLRDIFDQQEKSHKEEMLHRVDSLQMDIAKLYEQMAESKQTDGQAMAGPAAAEEDDDAETDEEFAVHIIETKKRKGEKKGQKKETQNGEVKSKKEKRKKRSHHEMELD